MENALDVTIQRDGHPLVTLVRPWAALGLALVLLAGCEAHDSPAPGTPSLSVLPGGEATEAATAGRSQELDVSGRFSMPAYSDGFWWAPAAAAGERIILKGTSPRPPHITQRFVLYDPITQAIDDLWSSPEGAQDALTSSDGDWLAISRMSPSLPFEDWTVMLRNWRTGEVREVAKSDPRVATYPGLHVGLPNGLAPNPQVRDGVVVWDEYFIAGTGVGKRIQQYVIATGLTSSVAQVDDARFEELSRPTYARGKTAWIRLTFADGKEDSVAIEVDLAEGGQVTSLTLPGRPFIISFSSDGRTLYWDDDIAQLKRTDLATMETQSILGRVGHWPFVSGRYVGAAPRTEVGDTWVGYFDEATSITYEHHIDDPAERSGVGMPLGKWFAWNVLVSDADGNNDPVRSALHFLPLE
ncbi:MAG TPA: hypothetical protein VFK32_09145 [Tepidiformaceae bacterium]|nr:hypothetical protein [Tepidiformaceae bacterium]